MFKVRSIVLTTALFGTQTRNTASAAPGCFPAYISSGTYASGDKVSATTTTESSEIVSCDPATDAACPASTYKTVVTTTTETYNYVCVDNANSAFCGNDGYAPNTAFGSIAWTKESGECSGTASAAAPVIPPAWSGTGCPATFAAADFSAGDVVSVPKSGGYSMVYSCKEEPNNLFCGMAGYAPGTDQYWSNAWTELGSCTGSMAPTDSPINVALADAGGCPGEYDGASEYEEGDAVSKDGLVFQCKPFPLSNHCSQTGYEPGTSVGSGTVVVEHWRDAWSVVGFCSGTIAPTGAPNHVALQDLGGCPDGWKETNSVTAYEEGDTVAEDGLVYTCKAWPMSGHCGQAGYKPNHNPATPQAWRDAWTVAGHCSGSIGPTSAPVSDTTAIGACPPEWERGSNVKYEEGDMVSLTVSEVPLRRVAYVCKAWPMSGYCGQFRPTEYGGDQGWKLAGSCEGSVGPTASPVFVSLGDYGTPGCPEPWNVGGTSYEAGDLVSFAVSTDPSRNLVYRCRTFPNSGYCNQGVGFMPGAKNGHMAWDLVGTCDGSRAPTSSPVAYGGTCEYNKCVTTTARVSCVPGESGCSCTAGYPAGPSCKKDLDTTTCSDVPVNAWSSSVDYVEGDVVRVATKRFVCKGYPAYFWCRLKNYKPELEPNNVWNQAWDEDGMCT